MATKKGAGRSKAQKEKGKRASHKRGAAKKRETASKLAAIKLAKALAHPLRVRILTVLNDRVASPNELHKLLEEGLSQVSYHIKVLRDYDLIEMIGTEPRRGAVEHYYRATLKVYVPSWIAATWPKSIRATTSITVLEEIGIDVGESIQAGLLADRPDEVMTRDSRTVDGQARADIEHAAAVFLEAFEEASRESDKRLKEGKGDGEKIQTTAAVMVFTSLKGRDLRVKAS